MLAKAGIPSSGFAGSQNSRDKHARPLTWYPRHHDGGISPMNGESICRNLQNPDQTLNPSRTTRKKGEGLCFSCNEKYHANHKCKNQVLLMCGEEDDVDK